jgi:hypothetical protein
MTLGKNTLLRLRALEAIASAGKHNEDTIEILGKILSLQDLTNLQIEFIRPTSSYEDERNLTSYVVCFRKGEMCCEKKIRESLEGLELPIVETAIMMKRQCALITPELYYVTQKGNSERFCLHFYDPNIQMTIPNGDNEAYEKFKLEFKEWLEMDRKTASDS